MAAPLGKRYGVGNNGGRPRTLESVEELQTKAKEYMDSTQQKNGLYKPTLTGLCFHLGFESLQSFYDYEKLEAFSYTIRRLRLFVQSCYEQQLYGFAWAGSAFALKNLAPADWRDEVTQNQNHKVEKVIIEEKKRED